MISKSKHCLPVSMVLVLFGLWYSTFLASAAEIDPFPDKYTLPAAHPSSINVGGTIITDTTWTLANSPYLVDSGITIANGVLLTIEPGVEVRFTSGTYLDIQGALRAIGTAAQPIAFTSTNATPQPGQWGGITFMDSSDDARSRMEYASIRYAGTYYGNSCYGGALTACSASPTLINSIISESAMSGLRASNSSLLLQDSTIQNNAQYGISLRDSTPQLQNNTIQNNQAGGVQLQSNTTALGALPWTDNQILNNFGDAISVIYDGGGGLPSLGTGNTINGNSGLNGLFISGSLGMATTWPTTYPLPLITSYLMINNGTELTISPGAQVLFTNDSDGLIVDGALRAIGTARPTNYLYSCQCHPAARPVVRYYFPDWQ